MGLNLFEDKCCGSKFRKRAERGFLGGMVVGTGSGGSTEFRTGENSTNGERVETRQKSLVVGWCFL